MQRDDDLPAGGPDAARPAEDGFRRYVEARWPQLIRYAFLFTGDHHTAEDVVQSALERCWRRWDRIEGPPEAYVRAAVANEAAGRRRRKRLPVAPIEAAESVPGAADPAERQVLRSGLWTALAELPPRQRAVVLLRAWEDRSEADTARILGISPGAVRSQLSKAMARLRTHPHIRDLRELPAEPVQEVPR